MRLNEAEFTEITQFLGSQGHVPQAETLVKLEIGIWIFPPYPLDAPRLQIPQQISQVEDGAPLFLCGQFGKVWSQYLLTVFREKQMPYLLVRINSWAAYIYCNGELLSEQCKEDLDAIREACEKLRRRCREMRPSVMGT